MTRQALELLILRMFLSGYFASSHLAPPQETGGTSSQPALCAAAAIRKSQ
jgi:hypothetical protein